MGLSSRLQKEEKALEMRARHLSFREIAIALGITEAAARGAVRRAQVKREIDKEQERRVEAESIRLLRKQLNELLHAEDLSTQDRVKVTAELRALGESYRKLINLDEKDDAGDRGITFNITTALPAEVIEVIDGDVVEEPRALESGGEQ